jgi:hypothetical protein
MLKSGFYTLVILGVMLSCGNLDRSFDNPDKIDETSISYLDSIEQDLEVFGLYGFSYISGGGNSVRLRSDSTYYARYHNYLGTYIDSGTFAMEGDWINFNSTFVDEGNVDSLERLYHFTQHKLYKKGIRLFPVDYSQNIDYGRFLIKGGGKFIEGYSLTNDSLLFNGKFVNNKLYNGFWFGAKIDSLGYQNIYEYERWEIVDTIKDYYLYIED